MMSVTPFTLEKTKLFQGIAPKDYDALLQCLQASSRFFSKGSFISLADDVPRVGLLIEGGIFLLKEDFYGNRHIIAHLDPGDLFGESFICGGASSLAFSIQASQDCAILFLSFEKALQTCHQNCIFHHTLIRNMVTLIAQKNLSLLDKLDITTRPNLRSKILTYLSQLAQKQNNPTVTSPMGRAELADFLGVNRSALTRELNHMEKDGLISFHRNCFTLHNKEAAGLEN